MIKVGGKTFYVYKVNDYCKSNEKWLIDDQVLFKLLTEYHTMIL